MTADEGSSPLTRGKPVGATRVRDGRRLIPAHAGKTQTADQQRRGLRAHPRSRGENPHAVIGILKLTGSSPLTRGKRGHGDDLAEAPRLIPAHAGKTALTTSCAPSCRAHPRSRGENSVGDAVERIGIGSSPLTRGKHAPRRTIRRDTGSSPLTRGKQGSPRRRVRPRGLIPAHAGKTPYSREP